MWASANTTNRKLAGDAAHRAVPVGGSDLASAKAYGTLTEDSFMKDLDTNATLVDDRELYGGSVVSGGSMKGVKSSNEKVDEDEDLEMQQVGRGGGGSRIGVSRTFSIRSGRT